MLSRLVLDCKEVPHSINQVYRLSLEVLYKIGVVQGRM